MLGAILACARTRNPQAAQLAFLEEDEREIFHSGVGGAVACGLLKADLHPDDQDEVMPADVFVTPLCAVQGTTEFYKIVRGAKGKELTHHVLASEILLGHKAPLEDVRMNGINLSAYRVCSTAQTEEPTRGGGEESTYIHDLAAWRVL